MLCLFVVGDAEEVGDGVAVGGFAEPDDAQAGEVSGLARGGEGFGLVQAGAGGVDGLGGEVGVLQPGPDVALAERGGAGEEDPVGGAVGGEAGRRKSTRAGRSR